MAEATRMSDSATAERRPRRLRTGVVTSDKGNKTIRVVASFTMRHAKYGKYMRRRTVMHAHDERNEAKVGDRVELMESRPISRIKRWRLVRILERAAS
ncbi:MAG TPA: 30S ribosomal protein S17 [Phycisphaerae bacterium]|jgi:small subunit ribosomal protein S17